MENPLLLVDPATLPRWGFVASQHSSKEASDMSYPFRSSPTINQKIILWKGDVTQLTIHAVVHAFAEDRKLTGLGAKLFAIAGPQIEEELKDEVPKMRTAEVYVTKAYNSPARHIIHTVSPRYKEMYRSATENAMFCTYRASMQQAVEHGLRSIAFTLLHNPTSGYSLQDGFNIGLRTVRRYIEKHPTCINTVLFCAQSQEEEDAYNELLPVYFPRSIDEEQRMVKHLPTDIGDENGEPFHAERKIRISANLVRRDSDPAVDAAPTLFEHETFNIFKSMSSDVDGARLELVQKKFEDKSSTLSSDDRYQLYLNRARTENFSEYHKMKFLYKSGVDNKGNSLLIVVGRNLPPEFLDDPKTIYYVMSVADSVAEDDYSVIYFHCDAPLELISSDFFKRLNHVIHGKYRSHLKTIYIVHPSLPLKMKMKFLTTFSFSELKPYIQYVPQLSVLFNGISPDQLDIPEFVTDFDRKVSDETTIKRTSSAGL